MKPILTLLSILSILISMSLTFKFAVAKENNTESTTDKSTDKWAGTVIKDPSVSSRCAALIDKRNKKIAHKQKIWVLMIRNKKLNKKISRKKKSIKKKLERNLSSLEHEYTYTENYIRNMTEDIILKGCPGMTL